MTRRQVGTGWSASLLASRPGEAGQGSTCAAGGMPAEGAGHRHALRRHQPHRPVRPNRLSGHLLRTRAGGEPHQGVEDPPRCRSHIVLPGQRQPAPPVPACRRVLAHVELAHAHAAPVALAGRSVRHAAATVHKAGGAHRGLEDESPPAPAADDARSGVVRIIADAHASPQHLIHGADCSTPHPMPINPNAHQPPKPNQRTRMGPTIAYEFHCLRLRKRHRITTRSMPW